MSRSNKKTSSTPAKTPVVKRDHGHLPSNSDLSGLIKMNMKTVMEEQAAELLSHMKSELLSYRNDSVGIINELRDLIKSQQQQIDLLNKAFEEIKNDHSMKISELEDKLKVTQTSLGSALLKIENMNSEIKTLKELPQFAKADTDLDNCAGQPSQTRVNALQQCVEETGMKNNDLEQYSRRNCLRFYGLPENMGENTDDIVLDMIHEKLELSISTNDIERSHRIGIINMNINNSKPRPIIVKFVSYRTRTQILSVRRKLKGSSLVVREDLTKQNQALLTAAGKVVGFKNVWSLDGKIFVKSEGERKLVRSLSDITNIK